ncbi:MAG: hypothetical protein KY455_11855 [Euryarchaeota archaeon]|nr:hypothetical protein [Euryarchaeota archaeon]
MDPRALALVLILTLGPVGTLTGAQAAHDGLPDVLWLGADPDGGRLHNFTTYPPGPEDPGERLEMHSVGNFTSITWRMIAIPADWTVESDTVIELELWIEGLDRVIAAADPLAFARHPGKVVVQAQLRHGNEGFFAKGETTIDPDPVSPQEGPRRLLMPIQVEREVAFANETGGGATFNLIITVLGHNRPETPLLAHVLSDQTPSRLTVESFPVDAFRAWEVHEALMRECAERLLRQESCRTTPVEENTPGPSPSAPVSWLLGIVALGVASAAVLVFGARRR